jgi:hypothetical protein
MATMSPGSKVDVSISSRRMYRTPLIRVPHVRGELKPSPARIPPLSRLSAELITLICQGAGVKPVSGLP